MGALGNRKTIPYTFPVQQAKFIQKRAQIKQIRKNLYGS